MPNVHGRYLHKRLPYTVPVVFARSDGTNGLFPPHLDAIKDWCNKNVGDSALKDYCSLGRSASIGPSVHRNPNGTWAYYKRTLYFKYAKDAIRVKLLGLVDFD